MAATASPSAITTPSLHPPDQEAIGGSGTFPNTRPLPRRLVRGLSGVCEAAAVIEVFNVLNTDDLRVFTYEPSKGEFKPGQGILLATPLQLDAERRFGRRFQIGLQLQF